MCHCAIYYLSTVAAAALFVGLIYHIAMDAGRQRRAERNKRFTHED